MAKALRANTEKIEEFTHPLVPIEEIKKMVK
jgi:hypothetical protein